jgi:hypothetical protein
MTITDLDDFKALDAFFRIIEQGLDGIADGRHFFDLLAEDVIFDYIVTTPGYPRRVEGRKAVAELYAAVFGLTENGLGLWSIDGALARSRWGTRWALAAGAAGSATVLRAARHEVAKETSLSSARPMAPARGR